MLKALRPFKHLLSGHNKSVAVSDDQEPEPIEPPPPEPTSDEEPANAA